MNDLTDIAEVYDLLYRLGFSATNTAFFHVSYAVYLAALNILNHMLKFGAVK